MVTPLQSLIASGTKVWLDSVDPDAVARNRAWGVTGATSNPIIISDLIKTGQFDEPLARFMREGLSDQEIAWELTDLLVRQAQQVFFPAWEATSGDDGYVSFELDPLLEDPDRNMPVAERTRQYISLGKKWSAGHKNRMIKVPATEAGIAALEELCAAGVTLNVTLGVLRLAVRCRPGRRLARRTAPAESQEPSSRSTASSSAGSTFTRNTTSRSFLRVPRGKWEFGTPSASGA